MHALGRTAALASHVREVTRQLERGRRLSERIDLAREVHERVTQRLFGVSLALGSDQPLADEDRERCAAEIEAALGDLREALIGSAGSSLMDLAGGRPALGARPSRPPVQAPAAGGRLAGWRRRAGEARAAGRLDPERGAPQRREACRARPR